MSNNIVASKDRFFWLLPELIFLHVDWRETNKWLWRLRWNCLLSARNWNWGQQDSLQNIVLKKYLEYFQTLLLFYGTIYQSACPSLQSHFMYFGGFTFWTATALKLWTYYIGGMTRNLIKNAAGYLVNKFWYCSRDVKFAHRNFFSARLETIF